MPTTWFIVRDGQQHGPITDAEFRKLIELGHLKGTDFVWHDGAPDWMPGTQFLAAPRGAMPSAGAAPTEPARPKSPSQGPSQGAAQSAGPSTPRSGARSPSAPNASKRPAKHRPGLRIAIGVLLAAVLAGAGKFAFDRLGFDESAFNKVGESLARPQSERAAIERRLLTDPKLKWLQILQEKQPSTYAELMDALMAR